MSKNIAKKILTLSAAISLLGIVAKSNVAVAAVAPVDGQFAAVTDSVTPVDGEFSEVTYVAAPTPTERPDLFVFGEDGALWAVDAVKDFVGGGL